MLSDDKLVEQILLGNENAAEELIKMCIRDRRKKACAEMSGKYEERKDERNSGFFSE